MGSDEEWTKHRGVNSSRGADNPKVLIGQIPSKEDYDQFVSKIKTEGEKKKKEIEASASKIMQKVEQARKEGKGSADAYLKGLKEGTSILDMFVAEWTGGVARRRIAVDGCFEE